MHKKRIAILAPYPSDEAPSQRFRFEQYLPILEENGYEYAVFPFLDLDSWNHYYSKGKIVKKLFGFSKGFFKRLILLFTIRKYDHVFIHREASPIGPPIFEFVISKLLGKKYIYDFDDAIWMANYSENNARFHRLKAYWKVKYCIKWAGKVSAGNEYLASYARKFNAEVKIIPTTIDTENHHNSIIDYQKEQLTIGWTGTHSTLRYLLPLLPVFKSISEKYNVPLAVISNENPDFDLANFTFIQWKKASEIEDLKQISIGVMPLEMDQWSEGKCGFKGLQYMSLGIPTVVSPVGVNKEIIDHGINGFLAIDLAEWQLYLEQLILDPVLREKIGRNGQQKVIDKYAVLAVKNNFLQLFIK